MAQSRRQRHSITLPPTNGLIIDEGEQRPGSFVKLKNFDLVEGGKKLRRRLKTNAVDSGVTSEEADCYSITELRKDSGTNYTVVDVSHPGACSDIDAPSVKPTLADAGASGNTSDIGSTSYTIPGDSGEVTGYTPVEGNSGHPNPGDYFSTWIYIDAIMNAAGVNAGYSLVIEIDGETTYGTDEKIINTYKWSKDGGSTWEDTNVTFPLAITTNDLPYGLNTNTGSVIWGDPYSGVMSIMGRIAKLDLGGGALAYVSFYPTLFNIGSRYTLSGGIGLSDQRWVLTPSFTGDSDDAYIGDDLTTGGTYSGAAIRQYVVKITTASTTDKFDWSDDGGVTWTEGVSITGAAQTLSNGVTVTFAATTGHLLGAKWTFTCTPADAPAAGKHYFKYTYVVLDDSDNDYCETNPSPSENITIADGHNITFTPTASGDADVDKIRIYMTTVGDTDTYYKVKDVDNASAASTIDSSDFDIMQNDTLISDRTGKYVRIIASENDSTSEVVSLSSSWTTIASNLTAGNTRPSYAMAMDMLFRCDGTNDNKVIEDTTTFRNNGIAAPEVAAALSSSSSSGDITPGTYRVYYTYVNKGTGYSVESYPSPYAEIELSGTAISVTVPMSADPNVTHIRIYRNIYNDFTYFYEAAEITNATTITTLIDDDVSISADDIVTDTQLKFYAKPPKATYCKWVKNRMFYANLPDETNGSSIIRPSLIYKPEQTSDDYDIRFDVLDGMEITGLGVLNENIYAFKKTKILQISPDSPFPTNKVANGKGCIDGETIRNIPDLNALIWLSPEGVVVWDGGSTFTNISKGRINARYNRGLMEFVDNGAIWISEYQTVTNTYHLIGYYRDDTTKAITDHRHFVYHFDGNGWTEYEQTDSDGNVVYEVALGTATDANGRQVMISGYIVDVDGNIIGIWQNDYMPDETTYPHAIQDDAVVWGYGDSSGNVYLINDTAICSIDTADTVTSLVTDSDVITAMGGDNWDSYDATVLDTVWDSTNEVIYLFVFGDCSKTVGYVNDLRYEYKILKCTTAGVLSTVVTAGYVQFEYDTTNAPTSYEVEEDVNGTTTTYTSTHAALNTYRNNFFRRVGPFYGNGSLAIDDTNDVLYFTTGDDDDAVYGSLYRDKIYRVTNPRTTPSAGLICEIPASTEIVAINNANVNYPNGSWGHFSYSSEGRAKMQYHDGYLYFVVDADAGLYGDNNYYLHDIITPYLARVNVTTGVYEELLELEHDGEELKGSITYGFVIDTNGHFYYYYDGKLRVATNSGGSWSDAFAGTTDTFDADKRWAYNNLGTYESNLLHITAEPYLDYEDRLLIWTGETNEGNAIYRQLMTDDTDYFEDKLFGSPAGSCPDGYTCSVGALCSSANGFIFFHRVASAPAE